MTPPDRLLIIVDPQNDFIDGALKIPGAESTINSLATFIASGGANRYSHIILSLDNHPATHCSFASNGGTWPDHCIAGSKGAEIWSPLKDALRYADTRYSALTKGTHHEREEYSIFGNELSRRRIIELADEYGATGADICGLAGDFCVKETFIDAAGIFGTDNVDILPLFIASTDNGGTINNLKRHSLCAR